MPGPALPVLGALALLPAFGQVAFDEIGVVSAEVGGGTDTGGPDDERSRFVYSEVRPSGLFLLRTGRTNVELGVGARVYYRLPNVAETNRPIVLGLASARHEYAFSPRLVWTTFGDVQYGEIDYTNTDLVFESPLARPAVDPVITALDTNGQTGFRWMVTERYALALAAVAAHTTATSPEDREAHPTTSTVGGDLTQSYELDEKSGLSFPVGGRYYFVTTAPDWATFSLSAVYRRSPNPRTTIEATLGATPTWRVDGEPRVYPRALGAFERVVHETRAARFSNRFTLGIDTTFDPLRGRVYPVGGFEVSLFGTLGEYWSASFAASGYTAVTSEPTAPESRDTTFSANASVGYELTDEWTLEFGARTTSYGPHATEDPFVLEGTEIWAFARLSGSFGARPDMRR